jgi:hypothetical protein
VFVVCSKHRLSINRPTKRGKKEMHDLLLACQPILEREPHSDTLCYRAGRPFTAVSTNS